jgi:hypothetical protein
MSVTNLLIASVVVVSIYLIVARGLFEVSKPIRSAMLRLAEELCADPRLDEDSRERVVTAVSLSASGWVAWLLAAYVIPAAIAEIARVYAYGWGHRRKDMPPEVTTKLRQFDGYWLLSVLLSAPVGFVVLLLVALPTFTIVGLLADASRLLRRIRSGSNGADYVVDRRVYVTGIGSVAAHMASNTPYVRHHDHEKEAA